VNAYEIKSGWSFGWQVKLCDPVNTCHSVALRDCLGRKNALYEYLILYSLYVTFITSNILAKCQSAIFDHYFAMSQKRRNIRGVKTAYHYTANFVKR